MSATQPTESERRQNLAALLKLQKGEGKSVNRAEKRAMAKCKSWNDYRTRWLNYRAVPKEDYERLSGRTRKVLDGQNDLWGIELRGATVDLEKTVRWFHDFFCKHKHELRRLRNKESDSMLSGATSPALEDYRRQKAALAKLDLKERQSELLSRDRIHEAFGRVAHIIRQAGDMLRRQYGADAQSILIGAIDDAEAKMETFFADQAVDDGK